MRNSNPIASLIAACLLWISAFSLWILTIVAIGAILAVFVMLLWNWLMPIIFGLKTITFLQSWGLMILSGLLFKSSYTSKKKKSDE